MEKGDVRELPTGHLVLFLHAHLPYVRHPEHEDFLEEDWLYEAITETYLPLLMKMDAWVRAKHPARITMSVSPPLSEMLSDPLLMGRYHVRLERLIRLAEKEVKRTARDERFASTATMHLERLSQCAHAFNEVYSRDLLGAWTGLQGEGVLELATCSATHAFLPHFAADPAFVRAQIRIAIEAHRAHFGRHPPGIWLPECGYYPGLDQFLADEGLCYFFVDAHGVLNADPAPVHGTMSPIICPSGVLAFPRDPESSQQVWSADSGYPGDGRYLEFYRDAGHDLSPEELEGFVLPDGGRRNVGLKYHRISARHIPLDEKEPYDRAAALEAVDTHAGNFVFNRTHQIDHWRRVMGRSPVVVSPYDAELFGHWWAEGPEFIDLVMQKAIYDQDVFRMSTPSDVIHSGLDFQAAQPSMSSWGAGGYGEVWLNEKNDWIFEAISEASAEFQRLLTHYPTPSALQRTYFGQLGRELLLASASDWPFILTMGTSVGYAEAQVRRHLERFDIVRQSLLLDGKTEASDILARMERVDDMLTIADRDRIFLTYDYRLFLEHFAPIWRDHP